MSGGLVCGGASAANELVSYLVSEGASVVLGCLDAWGECVLRGVLGCAWVFQKSGRLFFGTTD